MLARYEITGELIRGRIDDERLPYPLTGVTGHVFCDNERFQITQFEARRGPTLVRLECAGRRQGDRFPFRIEARLPFTGPGPAPPRCVARAVA